MIGRVGPRGSGQVKAPDFLDVQHYEGGRSSALCTDCLYPRRNPWYSFFQRLSQPQGTWFCQQLQKKSPVTPPGIDPETVRLVVQCFNHYATPGPILQLPGFNSKVVHMKIKMNKLAVGQSFHLVLFYPAKYCFTSTPYSCWPWCGNTQHIVRNLSLDVILGSFLGWTRSENI